MGSAVPEPAGSASPPPRQRPGAGMVLIIVNGVLAGVGGEYASTRSVWITVMAGVMAMVITAMVLVFQR